MNKSPSRSVIQTRSSGVGQVNQQTVKQNSYKTWIPELRYALHSNLSSKKFYYMLFDKGPKLCVPLFPQL